MAAVAFIHTSPLLVPVFSKLATARLPEAEFFHMLDESLLRRTIAAGRLEPLTIRRTLGMVVSASEAGADIVMVTCSSIGPAVEAARQFVDIPVLRVDEAMAEKAVQMGARIGVAATLPSTLEPTARLIEARAKALGLDRSITPRLCEGAFEAVSSGDAAAHDRLVRQGLEELSQDADVIVLAQASMARVADEAPPGSLPVPVLSSPALGVERLAEALAGI